MEKVTVIFNFDNIEDGRKTENVWSMVELEEKSIDLYKIILLHVKEIEKSDNVIHVEIQKIMTSRTNYCLKIYLKNGGIIEQNNFYIERFIIHE